MKKLITAIFMNKWIPTVTVIFIILCVASIFVHTLPFMWWYAIVWVAIRLLIAMLICWWVVTDERYYDWLYLISHDRNKKALIELKRLFESA